MSALLKRRWTLSFVAMRWRHLFWILPLLGLLTASWIEWQRIEKVREAHFIAELLPGTGLTPDATYCPSSFADFRDIVLSDSVLGDACYDARLLDSRDDVKPYVADLRPKLRVEKLRGTARFFVSIRGESNPKQVDLCKAIADRASDKVTRAGFKAVRKTIELRERLAGPPDIRTGPGSPFGILNPSLARIPGILPGPMPPGITGPELKFHEMPKAPAPLAFKDLVSPASKAGIWIGWAIAVAAVLAYLLEWSFPAKRPEGDLAIA